MQKKSNNISVDYSSEPSYTVVGVFKDGKLVDFSPSIDYLQLMHGTPSEQTLKGLNDATGNHTT